MLEVIVNFPAGMFKYDPEASLLFKAFLAEIVAEYMSALNPDTGEVVNYDPLTGVYITALPYDPLMSRTTATVLLKVITYDWPDRMASIKERLQAICDDIALSVPDALIGPGQDAVSATFPGKVAGCWATARKSILDPL